MKTNVSLLIKKSVDAVFEAFINPEITTKFWFTKSSGKLVKGEKITWEWEMYGVSDEISVLEIIPSSRIHIRDSNLKETIFEFETYSETETIVKIENGEFDQLSEIVDSTEGYTLVLSGLKAYLEHGIQLNLVEDKHPKARIDREK
ncbi:SRPBCC domain-containing protein [Listeria fleischmannii]|uniref:Activator of Hsp90 ATPase 1 family protein n=1 Tax=Listeria fleischmannii FSL S10-1203 TaxID=1265822 RepID=W7DKR0_9LIST|nr:SRPBCC domain-containing protein [Listeria fleischmannii]EUJ52574.1 Activator of Hsp90 ATPase 1 family protein [Listeria fleischmannii FSL S10-1203]